jgi:tetratricopeptide (TPR) repeat protein
MYDEKVLRSLQLQRGDARALAAQAVAAAPDSVPARLLEAVLLVCSRDVRDYEAAGWAYARLRALPMSGAERAHTAALAAALDGDLERACRVYDRILDAEPRDFLALWAAQLTDYFLGNALALRERAARALAHLPQDLPGHHAALSMYAFALQECGDYAPAEEAALKALALEPRDLRAQHTLLHVYEMLDRPADGLRWAGRHAAQWHDAAAGHHLWWHVALFMVGLDRPHGALAVYDLRMQQDTIAGLIDASSLLWRLHLRRFDVGARFATLAGRWAQHADDAHCAFNDLHAMMAFAGAGRWDLAARLLAAQERRLARPAGANRDMTRLAGYPACRALLAFARGDWRSAEALLRSLPPVAHRIGGSHAQRDVLQLTRAAAAARRGPSMKKEPHGIALPQSLAAA